MFALKRDVRQISSFKYTIISNTFSRYSFRTLTVERPAAKLRALLQASGYAYLKDHGDFGDQLWAHASFAAQAARVLNISLPVAPQHYLMLSPPR